jgi:phosphatidylserine/phosphatidylglycerophosphate/cardiolipin synthase-like enzyme
VAEKSENVARPGQSCWRTARAGRAALIVDACDYFAHARAAMLRAERQILLIGWDFDTRILLQPDEARDEAPRKLGAFINWLARRRPDLSIHILKWDVGAIKLLGRGTTLFRLARWAWDRQIHFKLDGAHPFGGCHHQKIIVIDDRLAFCGGIDMTADRWDTREHLDRDGRRRRPTTGRRYGPWHDASMAIDGDAARALGDLARDRWHRAGGERIDPPGQDSDPWPERLRPQFRDVDVAVARTRGAGEDEPAVREIEALFARMIRRARRFIYAENQYFASRAVAAAIAERLAEPDPPEIVIVNPRKQDGWLEEEVMGGARAGLMRALGRIDSGKRLRVYSPVTAKGEDIYVHAKLMIVDDEMLRVGSANLNNRSMGLDSECDLLIDCGADPDCRRAIAAVRADLLAEHLGRAPRAVDARLAETGSVIATIESLRGACRTLRPFEPPEPGPLQRKIADSELLDPESAGGNFEPLARPGLFAGLKRRLWSGTRRAG